MAWLAEDAGADGITMHIREDRRHVQLRMCMVMPSAPASSEAVALNLLGSSRFVPDAEWRSHMALYSLLISFFKPNSVP